MVFLKYLSFPKEYNANNNKTTFFILKGGARQGFDLAPTYLYQDRESKLRSSLLEYL